MEKITDAIRTVYLVISNTSITMLLLGFVLISLPNWTNKLEYWSWLILDFNISVDELFFHLGITFFLGGLLFLVYIHTKIFLLQRKYPISKLEVEFFVIDVKGNAFLLDVKDKKIRWIQNWQTLSDLKLNAYLLVLFPHKERLEHWSNYTSREIELKARERLGDELGESRYSFGKGILTRGVPGT